MLGDGGKQVDSDEQSDDGGEKSDSGRQSGYYSILDDILDDMPELDDDDDDLDDEIQAPSFSPISCASESTPSEPTIGHESDTDKSLQSEMVYMHVILIIFK